MIDINKLKVSINGIVLQNKTIIRSFNYVFEKGKNYGLVGANGSGKTTLMKKLMFNEWFGSRVQVSGAF